MENNNKKNNKIDFEVLGPILFLLIAVILMAICSHFMGNV